MARLPLKNVRVADFSWAAVGPYATLLLASMGAQVIKISPVSPVGGFPRQRAATIGRYLNYNKRDITLDLSIPEGVSLAKELIRVSDLVVENYRPGTMKRFDLEYEELLKVKPDLVMISASSLGQEGSEARYSGFAPIFAAMSGLSHMTGYTDGIPTELRIMVDSTVGYNLAYAALVTLYHQRATGEGQYVDLACRDAAVSLLGEAMLDASLNGSPQQRMGNRDRAMAPHGVYRCKGEDVWISIAVATEEEWEGLCQAMGRTAWAKEEKFLDAESRWQNQDELDSYLSAWTQQFDAFELMALLQARGVAAVPSFSVKDLFSDPHLRERQFAQKVTDPQGESYTVLAAPWLMDGQRPPVRRHSPSAGEDNQEVLEELLGLPSQEIDHLVEKGVLK